ncbi:MAG: TonB C-terminal domain-containing protein [Myxococcota bacterium]
MHRPIHEVWAWGVLERLEAEERSHPLNDRDLWTRVEIVVGSEGRIENVTTIRFSGDAGFDEVARLSVHASGPYPTPPEGIRSGNGKVYVHWTFHRDERACGTSGNATIHH